MQEEMLDELFDDDSLEVAANEEVNKLIDEIMGQKLAGLPAKAV